MTPPLIQQDDIRAELHSHTVATDGELQIEQLIQLAIARGYHTIAITDHSQSSPEANGLFPDALRDHLRAIRAAAERIEDITVLAGAEVDILEDGSLDYDDELLAELDFVIASVHHVLDQPPAVATKRLLRAITHPFVHVLGHPTAREIDHVPGLMPDMQALVEAAAAHHTALEINSNPIRCDLRPAHVQLAMDAGALFSVNCDVHRTGHFDRLVHGIETAREGGLVADRCINTWTHEKLHEWISTKTSRAVSSR